MTEESKGAEMVEPPPGVPENLRQPEKGTRRTSANERARKKTEKEDVFHYYYLSTSIKVEKIDPKEETLHVKMFMKLHFKLPDFARRVIAGTQHVPPDGSLALESSLGGEREADKRLKTVAQWLELTRPDMPQPDEEQDSHIHLAACKLHSPDSADFPVNLDHIIDNIASNEYTENPSLSWIEYWPPKRTSAAVEAAGAASTNKNGFREEVDDALDGLIVAQLVFGATIKAVMNMREFPYDRHVIPIGIATRTWTTHKEEENIITFFKHSWVLQLECLEKMKDEKPVRDDDGNTIREWQPPLWARPNGKIYSEQYFVVSEDVAWVDDDEEFDHLKPCLQAKKLLYWRKKVGSGVHNHESNLIRTALDPQEYKLSVFDPPEVQVEKRREALKKWKAEKQKGEFNEKQFRVHLPRDLGDRLGLVKPRLCLRLQRDPSHFLLNVAIPMFTIILLCLSTFFLSFDNTDLRIEAILISALAAAAYRTAITEQIPQKTYFMYGDGYFIGIYIYLAVFCVKVILAYQGLHTGVGFFWYNGQNEGDDDDEDFTSKQRVYQYLDDTASWFLLLLWVIIHLVMFADLIEHSETRFVRKLLHPKWETKMIMASHLTQNKYEFGHNDILHLDQLEEQDKQDRNKNK